LRHPRDLGAAEVARLLCGTGMRINEALQLRVKNIDYSHKAIIVRHGKGGKDRVVMLPASLEAGLREQLNSARAFWDADQAAGRAGVFMPYSLERKCPRAGASWSWFWVFPVRSPADTSRLSPDMNGLPPSRRPRTTGNGRQRVSLMNPMRPVTRWLW